MSDFTEDTPYHDFYDTQDITTILKHLPAYTKLPFTRLIAATTENFTRIVKMAQHTSDLKNWYESTSTLPAALSTPSVYPHAYSSAYTFFPSVPPSIIPANAIEHLFHKNPLPPDSPSPYGFYNSLIVKEIDRANLRIHALALSEYERIYSLVQQGNNAGHAHILSTFPNTYTASITTFTTALTALISGTTIPPHHHALLLSHYENELEDSLKFIFFKQGYMTPTNIIHSLKDSLPYSLINKITTIYEDDLKKKAELKKKDKHKQPYTPHTPINNNSNNTPKSTPRISHSPVPFKDPSAATTPKDIIKAHTPHTINPITPHSSNSNNNAPPPPL
jgi:hypothetical protein